MVNPFDAIDARLTNIENLLLDIKHADDPVHKDPVNEWLTKRQVAEMLQVTTVTVDNWRRAGRLKWHRVENTVRFQRDHVLQLIAGQ